MLGGRVAPAPWPSPGGTNRGCDPLRSGCAPARHPIPPPPYCAWTALMDATVPLGTSTAASRELNPLMRSVAAGSRGALAELYQRTSAKLFGICLRVLG